MKYESLEVASIISLSFSLSLSLSLSPLCLSSGLLQKEQDSAVVYGSIDTGKTVITHDKFSELVSKFLCCIKIHISFIYKKLIG